MMTVSKVSNMIRGVNRTVRRIVGLLEYCGRTASGWFEVSPPS